MQTSERRSLASRVVASVAVALLALPGGGKSLLLKRLAVAYADSARRKQSDDNLPDLDVEGTSLQKATPADDKEPQRVS